MATTIDPDAPECAAPDSMNTPPLETDAFPDWRKIWPPYEAPPCPPRIEREPPVDKDEDPEVNSALPPLEELNECPPDKRKTPASA